MSGIKKYVVSASVFIINLVLMGAGFLIIKNQEQAKSQKANEELNNQLQGEIDTQDNLEDVASASVPETASAEAENGDNQFPVDSSEASPATSTNPAPNALPATVAPVTTPAPKVAAPKTTSSSSSSSSESSSSSKKKSSSSKSSSKSKTS